MRWSKPLTSCKTVFFGLLLSTASAAAHAATVTQMTDLYSFEVIVADTSRAQRKTGLINGLEQVMVRITGDKRIGTHPAAAGLFGQAENFIQRYGYSKREVVEEPANPEESVSPEEAEDSAVNTHVEPDVFAERKETRTEIVLSGRFEASTLDRALREGGLPVWDARRPLVLLLGSLEDGSDSHSFIHESLQPVLEDAAKLRGLPIRLPVEGGLDARSVWKGDRFAFEDAAQAAGVDYVQWSGISRQGKAEEESSLQWVVEAALYQKSELVREWYFNASSEEVALRRLVDELSDWMASRYAVVSRKGGSSVIGLHISGVDNTDDYARVQEILAEQGSIQKIELVALGSKTVIYRVTTRSDVRQFENSLGLTRQLVPGTPSEQHIQAPIWLGEIELHYRLK